MVDRFRFRANMVEKSQKLQRLRILSCPFVLDEIRPSVVFLRGRVSARGRERARARGCGRVAASVRAGVRVCRRKGALVSVVLFLFLLVCLTLIGHSTR